MFKTCDVLECTNAVIKAFVTSFKSATGSTLCCKRDTNIPTVEVLRVTIVVTMLVVAVVAAGVAATLVLVLGSLSGSGSSSRSDSVVVVSAVVVVAFAVATIEVPGG
jgi:hypothetical protein